MKGSSRSMMKEDSSTSGKTRIGTRSAGRLSISPSKSVRLTKTGTRSPRILAPKSPRIISPGSSFGRLRANRGRQDKVETPRMQKTPDTTSKHVVTSKSEPVPQGSQSSQVSQGSQSAPNTPKGVGIRTRLSTGSIQMNGTMTISAAKEKAEMEQIIKQITKSDTVTPTKTPPVSLKKRTSQVALLPYEGLLSDHPPPKRRKIGRNDGSGEDNRNDYFCWLCHKEGSLVCCELCPRVYHTRCLGLSASLPHDWVCPECEKIMRAECVDTRSKSMEMLTIEQTCSLLKYAVERMKHAGSEPFQNAVDLSAVPNYSDYIFHPMDITTLEKNIKNKMYGCTEALLADTKWILHNCIIYNGAHNKLTGSAKMIIKICKHEMNEIELCPDCYLNSCLRKNDDWFSETCRVPHTLVWAKLKGYPFWPSKALREVDGQVDVRFFGAHDRSWVPVSQCFLLSKNIPTSLQKGRKNNGLDMAIEELNLHVKKIREKFGGFEYAPFRTPYDKTDSYKPICIKSELESKPNPVRLTQNREVKTSSGSNFSSHKVNILRKSAVSKTASALRNKYSAMVSLKKLDMTPEKIKKRSHLEEESASGYVVKDNEKYVAECVSKPTDDDNRIVVKIEPETLENKGIESLADTEVAKESKESSKESKLGKGTTPEKVIKKSFVSSSLIERLENKLKALDDETITATDSKELKVEILDEKHLELLSGVAEKDKLNSETQSIINVAATSCNEDKGSFEREIKSEVEDIKDSEVIEEIDAAEGNVTNEENNSVGLTSLSDKEIDQNQTEKLNTGAGKDDIESKDSYRRKLDIMIKSCKEKLGMDKEDHESAMSGDDDDDDDGHEGSSDESDENESSESDDEEKLMDLDNDEEKEKEGSEMEVDGDILKQDAEAIVDAKSCVTVSETPELSASEKQQNSENVTNDTDTTRELEHKSGKKTLEDEEVTSENVKMTTPSSEHEHGSRFTGVCKESDKEKVNDLISSDISGGKSDPLTLSTESVHGLKSPEHGNNKQHESCSIEGVTENSESEDRLVLSPNESSNSTTASKLSPNLHAGVKKIKTMLSKVLDPISGELMDKTTTDEDSDADRLVIDLEEESDQNQSKNRTQVIGSAEKKQSEHGTKIFSSPEPEKINLNEEIDKAVKKFPKYSTESRNKKDEKRRPSSEHMIPVKGSTQSSDPEEGTQSIDHEERTQSNERKDRTPSGESEEKAQSNKRKDRTVSKELEERTPSNECEDGVQSAEQEKRTHSGGAEERPVSGEQMDTDVEVLEDLSSPILNMDSCLPDKNFVRTPPRTTESSLDIPSSSKMAEKFSKKLLETIQTTMDEMCSEVYKETNDLRSTDVLSQQLAQARWNFSSELNELKHNFQLTMYEMKSGWETEKEQIIKSLTAKHQTDKDQAVKESKKKQWCAQCGKEAIFYCCWNTSYCDYPCQQGHWPQHMHTCLQTNKDKIAAAGIAQGQGHAVSQSASSIPVSIGPSVTPQISVPSATPPVVDGDHLRRLQENISMALHREEEKRGEPRLRPGLGSTSMMFNMQSPSPVMQQIQRTRFIGQQQMAMQVQQRSGLSQSQQGNPRMLFSQPLIQQAIYPLQVQPQQQLGGTILFQNPQQNLMTYGMPPRPPY